MKEALLELGRYRGLLYVITRRDIRVKYKQSIMGFMWAIFMPLLIVMVGLLVRYVFSVISGEPVEFEAVLGVAVRSLPWALVVASIRFASSSLISNTNLVTKIYFPKEIFPLSAVGANLFDFAVASVPLILLLAVAGVGAGVQLLWLPVLLVVLLMIVSGTALLVSAGSLFFRDVKYIVEVLLTFGIFFTPVFYDVSMLGDYGVYMMLNPLSPVLEGLESVIMRNEPPDLTWLFYSFAVGAVLLVGGYAFFKELEPAFAESI